MEKKLFDSERKVMEVLWKRGDLTAGQIAAILKEETGWNRNTTYTVIKKCIEKGAIQRTDPKFLCHALISRRQVQEYETEELIGRVFDGSRSEFLSAFFGGKGITKAQADQMRRLIDRLEADSEGTDES